MKNLVSWAKLHLFCASQGVVSSLWDGFPCPCAAVDSSVGPWEWAGAVRQQLWHTLWPSMFCDACGN